MKEFFDISKLYSCVSKMSFTLLNIASRLFYNALLEIVSGIKKGLYTVRNKVCLNSYIKRRLRFWSLSKSPLFQTVWEPSL